MVSGRHCTLRRLHLPIRQLCELFCHDEQLFLLQFQHRPSELDFVVKQLEHHSELGLVDLFSLFDGQDRFVAHFRIDAFSPETGLLGFHGGSFEASPALGRVFLEGSLLLLEAALATYEWTHVLSNCLSTNRATSHFLSGLGFQRRYVARSQRLVGGNPADVAHFCLARKAYLDNRFRKRLIGDKHVATLPDSPAERTGRSIAHCIDLHDSLHRSVMESCRRVLSEFGSAGVGSRLRVVDEDHVACFLGTAIAEILAYWKLYTGMDGRPEGLNDVIASWGAYTRLMSLLPLCVLDEAGVRPVAFFVIRLFPGNHSLAEIAGCGLDGADPAKFASEVRALLSHFLKRTGLCRIQSRGRGGNSLWHTHLGFTYEGRDQEEIDMYSMVSGDVGAPR